MVKEDVKVIYKLMKEKKYDQIYKLYGQKTYTLVAPYIYQKKDIKRLLKEGRFYDIYEKYGEKVYLNYINKMMRMDVINEVGVRPGFINCLYFEKLKKKLVLMKKTALVAGCAFASLPVALSGLGTMTINDNKAVYQDLVDEYDKEIEEYAKYINSLGLTDLEIIVKVMNDMWSNIEGYKNPERYDDIGYNRLSLYYDGYGVCRNMADDFTARMNAINPEYEACNISVYIDSAQTNGIKRNIIISNETVEEIPSEIEESIDCTKIFGNHMVSCIKLKDKNLILIVDPTNPSIGILKNGEIKMLSKAVDGIDIKDFGTAILGVDGYIKYQKKILESIFAAGQYDKIKDEFGIAAQNEVLEELIEKYDEDAYHVKKNK